MIETENLKLFPCDKAILQSAIQGNEFLAKKLNVTVQDNWTEFGINALQYSFDRLLESEEEKNWWTQVISIFILAGIQHKIINEGKPVTEK